MKRDRGFEKWYAENKESEHLWDTYQNCCLDLEQSTGEKAPTFKQWCREYYDKADDNGLFATESESDPLRGL